MQFNVQNVYKGMPLGSTAIEERRRADVSRWTSGNAVTASNGLLWLRGNLWGKHGSSELSWVGFKWPNLYYLSYESPDGGLHRERQYFSKVAPWTCGNCSRELKDEGYLQTMLPTAGATNPSWKAKSLLSFTKSTTDTSNLWNMRYQKQLP